jgi:hypothetical protein
MNLYKINYYSYEDSSKFVLSHPKSFSQEEFDELVSDCYVEAYLQYINSEEYLEDKKYRKEHPERYDKDDERIYFDDLIKIVVEILKTKFNFIEINPEISFTVFGWSSVNKDDWTDDSIKNNKLVRDKIKNIKNT